MKPRNPADVAEIGREELRRGMRSTRSLFIFAAIFSFFVNLLMLTGPLFMLQVYDRVLSSRSFETLVGLFAVVCFLYLIMGVLDYLRARLLARAGARFQATFDQRVFQATLSTAISPSARTQPSTASQDVDSIQRVLAGPAPLALFDAPWTPIYLAAIAIFHPWLGALALGGAVFLFALTLINEWVSRKAQRAAAEANAQSESFENAVRREAEAVRALGMAGSVAQQWSQSRDAGLDSNISASDGAGVIQAVSKTARFFLQSAMLGLGAYLVLLEEITPGVMIAASIILGRALAPVEQAIGQWAAIQRARLGWRRICALLGTAPAPGDKTPLPRPNGPLVARGLSAGAPGEAAPLLRNLTFAVEPGEALGIIGPSGSGKTTLSRIMAGVWRPLAGEIRLAGATLDQWEPDALGRLVGYLPQDVGLLSGTIAQNIARFDAEPDAQEIMRAAKEAGAHELILTLPQGYDTQVGVGGSQVSGGQRQRIALARAFYGAPPLLILDEPNANLDARGEQALTQALAKAKSRGAIIIVVAHRPSAIALCDKVLMLEEGRQRAFGPRDEVLQQTTRNFAQLQKRAEELKASVGENA